jgi:RNA polymerase sigma factor (sigma-70 family)
MSDALLLARFVDQWDHAAFRDLVCRHGPMVLGVCRRILRDSHAADDAFQVTFLLLARKAGMIRKRASLGPWLHGVAHRVALQARNARSQPQVPVGRDLEAQVDDHDGLERAELHAALHEELGQLPEKYRAPLVLCYIEGHPHEAVAQALGWPIGTVRGRIARGRSLLGARLLRRGLAPASVLLALGLLPKTAAAVPVALVDRAVRAAARVAAGERVPRGELPTRVANLEMKVRTAMQLTKLKWATALSLGILGTVAGMAAVVPTVLAAADDIANAKAELKKFQGTWVPISVEKGGVKQEKQGDADELLTIDGENFSTSHGGHIEQKGTIKLDPSKSPSEIDLQIQDGKDAGKTGLGIYAWDGATLKLCLGDLESGTRPADFTTRPDERVLVVLKRQNP